MTDAGRIQQAAQFLFEEHRARKPFQAIAESLAPRSIDEAYAVQEAFHALMAPTHGAVAGYKVALTTAVMRRMVGFDEPAAGAILAATVQRSPVTIRSRDYVRLGVEGEIAFQLGAALPAANAPYSRERVAAAVAAAMAAFELIEDRNADYTIFAAHILTCIADNAWNAGIVLGPPLTDWTSLDLAAARGAMLINGTQVGEGRGRDVMGHPLEALVWLANMLARRGKSLQPGMIVMTGSLVTTQFLHPGDAVQLSVDGLGEASLRVV